MSSLTPLYQRIVRSRWPLAVAATAFGVLLWQGDAASPGLMVVLAVAVLGAIVYAQDSESRRREAEQRLAEQRPSDPMALACSMAATLPDPIVLMDHRGVILFQNDAADSVLGHRERGQHISSALRAPQILEAIARVQETREIVRAEYNQPVPIERTFEVVVAPIADGHVGGISRPSPAIIMLMRDLTQKGRIERMRADFVTYASHELRTPLSSLIGFVETLQGSARNDPAARDRFLNIMRIEAVRMSRLIDDLLSLSRIELNVHLLPTQEVDVGGVVDHVIDVLSPLAEENGVTVQRVSRSPLRALIVNGDYDELVQVFQNLVENAIKYGQDGKLVELDAKPAAIDLRGEPAAGVVVSVTDFGPGIPAEHIPRLTERFYRVDASHSREKGGTGLGLAIVKHILNRHRGSLAIKSELGSGSTFIVSLPLAGALGDSVIRKSA